MAELPMEVIQHIFDFLPLQEIHRLRKDPQLQEVLQQQNPSEVTLYPEGILQSRSKSIVLDDDHEMSGHECTLVAPQCEDLSIDAWIQPKGRWKLPQLKVLRIYSYEEKFDHWFHIVDCPSVCLYFHSYETWKLGPKTKSLSCDVSTMRPSNLKVLESLDLDSSSIRPTMTPEEREWALAIRDLSLRTLRLRSIGCPEFFQILFSWPSQLETLVLEHTRDQKHQVSVNQILRSCPKLRTLSWRASNLNQFDFENADLSRCNLESLDMSQNWALSSMRDLKLPTSLQSLHLFGILTLWPSVLDKTTWKHLSLTCTSENAPHIVDLICQCEQLESLVLSIESLPLQWLFRSNGPSKCHISLQKPGQTTPVVTSMAGGFGSTFLLPQYNVERVRTVWTAWLQSYENNCILDLSKLDNVF